MSITAKQQIYRVRRSYNQWVNNQTLEDYSLRFTAKASRRWSLMQVANTALGAISFLALEAIGAAITISYGFENTVLAVLVVGALIFFAGLPVCYYAAKYGVDIDLLTRGAGFGYIGSTATSLIYASFTFIFFALEAAIMAKALEIVFGLPLAFGYIVSSLIVLPMVFYGITFISRFQLWTQPLWVALQLIPFVFILSQNAEVFSEWRAYPGKSGGDGSFNLFYFGAAASVIFSLVAQIGEQVDFLRFFPEKTSKNRVKWWAALIASGPGWIIIGMIKILAGSFLVFVAMSYGASIEDAVDPTHMYAIAFEFVTENSQIALIIAGVFVVISQLKINVTNAYAGSIAWSNFFSRLTHSHPGRVVWLVFNVAIALLLMELGIYHAFENTLSIYAIVAVSWVGSLVADLVINKPLGLSPPHIEFKRAHLYDINPVGVGAMVVSSILGIVAYLGVFGDVVHALAHFIALASTFILVPLIAWLTKGRYYIAREPLIFPVKEQNLECCVCQNDFESEDMAFCPAYEGHICSLCCSLDARCQDVCKTGEKITEKCIEFFKRYSPSFLRDYINVRFVHFVGLLFVVASVTGILLALIFSTITTGNSETNALIENILWKVFFILMIVAGVISWLFVLAHESRVVAQLESQTQTHRLVEEIEAHENTDKQLQKAKEQAEAANNAKSRYLTGLSHELRTPLNTVLGYAQLMEGDPNIPKSTQDQISIIRRSSAHLADLIEGLLDISKIEAGRLDIQRDRIRLDVLMNQIVHMFRLQAEERGLSFIYQCHTRLPKIVLGDEKRLRQILINLLSNAIKFTEKGEVVLSVSYRNQVAQFDVSDTGLGIPEDALERIFKPFERVSRPGTRNIKGTGLGLTITRLLTEIMGGDISVKNNEKNGVTFSLWLMLSDVFEPQESNLSSRRIVGYFGSRKSVLVVDDEETHRSLVSDILSPLGFIVVEAENSERCLDMIDNVIPDLFIVDRLLPGIDGATLINIIKERKIQSPVIMMSANANEDLLSDEADPNYNDYIAKPIKIDTMLSSIASLLGISWHYSDEEPLNLNNSKPIEAITLPSRSWCKQIVSQAEIGHLSGLKNIAEKLESESETNKDIVELLNNYVKDVNLKKIIDVFKVGVNG